MEMQFSFLVSNKRLSEVHARLYPRFSLRCSSTSQGFFHFVVSFPFFLTIPRLFRKQQQLQRQFFQSSFVPAHSLLFIRPIQWLLVDHAIAERNTLLENSVSASNLETVTRIFSSDEFRPRSRRKLLSGESKPRKSAAEKSVELFSFVRGRETQKSPVRRVFL